MTHKELVERLETIRPNCQWSLSGDSYEGLTWVDEVHQKPTPEELGL